MFFPFFVLLPTPPPGVGNSEAAPVGNDGELARNALHGHSNLSDDPRIRLPPLGDVVGSRVPLSARDMADCRKIHQMLRRMPLDRAWRRRGWLCMLYTRATRAGRCSPSLRGGFAYSAWTVAPSAAFAGGESDAHQVVNLCTTCVKMSDLAGGVSTRARSSKKTEPGLRGVNVRRGGLGAAATPCEPRKRRASDDTEGGSASSIVVAGRKGTKPVACSCASVPNKNIATNKLDSDNEPRAKRKARTAKRHLAARAETEEIHRKSFRDLVGRLFEVQGDQSIVRKVIAWL